MKKDVSDWWEEEEVRSTSPEEDDLPADFLDDAVPLEDRDGNVIEDNYHGDLYEGQDDI